MTRILCWTLPTALLFLGFAKAADGQGTVVSIDGLASRTPPGWKEVEKPSQFRFKHFMLPKGADDKVDTEMIIYFFGPGQGGGAEENIRRWKGFFQPPEGKSVNDISKVEEFKVGNVATTYLDISGTYLFRARPADPKVEPRPNHRMLAVVFESPRGPYFFRLVGPEKTVAQHKKGFDEWLKSFK